MRLLTQSPGRRDCLCFFFLPFAFMLLCSPAGRTQYIFHTPMAWCSLLMLKVPLNTNKPNQTISAELPICHTRMWTKQECYLPVGKSVKWYLSAFNTVDDITKRTHNDDWANSVICVVSKTLLSSAYTSDSCLFGLVVECATARLSTRPGLVSCTEPGTNPARGAKIRSGTYAIGLISWAASEGSTVSSLICDHWLIRKLATFMCYIQLTWRSVAAAGLDLQRTSEKGSGGKALQHRPGACHTVQYICTL